MQQLYDGLAVFARGSRELGTEMHPGLSLVAFTVLSHVEARPDARLVDLAAEWGLDKSTLSRQINQLVSDGLISRADEQPGRRGQTLTLTDSGRSALRRAAASIQNRLITKLAIWSDDDIAQFASLITRFNQMDD